MDSIRPQMSKLWNRRGRNKSDEDIAMTVERDENSAEGACDWISI